MLATLYISACIMAVTPSRQSGETVRRRKAAIENIQEEKYEEAVKLYKTMMEEEEANADDYNNCAVCLQELDNLDESLETYREGIRRFYHNEKLHRNLGLMLEERSEKLWREGKKMTEEVDKLNEEAISHLTFALRLNLAKLWEKHASKIPKQKRIEVGGKKTIAIFYRTRSELTLEDGVWGPRQLLEDGHRSDRGEDHLVFLARHMVKEGFNVEVYANLLEKDVGMDREGVMWRPFYALHAMLPPVWNGTHVLWPKMPVDKQPDVFISLQNLEGAHLFNSSVHEARNITPPVSFLWLRDLLKSPSSLSPSYVGPLHGVYLNSNFQASMTPSDFPDCMRLMKPAIEQEPPWVIRQTENSNRRFLFAGSPFAGLGLLLHQWPRIRSSLLDLSPTLEILFDFSQGDEKKHKGTSWYADLKQKIHDMVQQEGVIFRAPLSQRKVSRAFARSGFCLYPSSLPETRSADMSKAMLMGCIPISSRTPYSALNETCFPFDLGPSPLPFVTNVSNPQELRFELNPSWVAAWTDAVIRAARMPEEELAEIRDSMIRSSSSRLSWSLVAADLAMAWRRDIESGSQGSCGKPVEQVVKRRDPSEQPKDSNVKQEL